MNNRPDRVERWLNEVVDEPLLSLSLASEDASFRRYLRAETASTSFVVMDAPPDKEPLDDFVIINRALTQQGVHAPTIYAQNHEAGFLLLEDLGKQTYLDVLQNSNDGLYNTLYTEAIAALVQIQVGIHEQANLSLPHYDEILLNQELELFDDWYLKRHLDVVLNPEQRIIWHDTREFLVAACLEQPLVWVHRDYHSRNLMACDRHSPGVIDFQDMLIGPISYDIASLFKDCYIQWPRADQHRWLEEYRLLVSKRMPTLQIGHEQLIRWVDLTGLQRHLKVLGIFCRLNYRDGKKHYINDLPLVKKYVLETIELYPELDNFRVVLDSIPKALS